MSSPVQDVFYTLQCKTNLEVLVICGRGLEVLQLQHLQQGFLVGDEVV